MTILSEDATRSQIADLIANLRAKATRYSVRDPRREALDDECDRLVDDWLLARE